MITHRAYALLNVKDVDEDRRSITGIATTPTPDRMGDIVESEGAEFQLPIPLLWHHDSRQPVGHVVEAKVTKDGIRIRADFVKIDESGRLKERLDEAWHSVKYRLVQGLSIGFKSLESSFIDDTYSLRFLRWLWLELSVVTIPANGEASITAVKSLVEAETAALGRKPATPPGVLGKAIQPVKLIDPVKVKPLTVLLPGQRRP
jgi:HK97 family phage prohead protease